MKKTTAWEKTGDWYDKIVGSGGHLYHKEVILPYLLPLLKKRKSILDCACGQGILSRAVDKETGYVGLDLSRSLLKSAKERSKREFREQDICEPFSLGKTFSDVVCLLAFQNLEKPEGFIANANKHLEKGGRLIVVMNHPCFRIPRQSGWGVDEKKKMQYRKVEKYMSAMEIPLQAHPSQKEASEIIRTFHHPLSAIVQMFAEGGFVITGMDELRSHKKSTGKNARMENRARTEFPLFLSVVAQKVGM